MKRWPACDRTTSTAQNGTDTKRAISRSRSTTRRSVGEQPAQVHADQPVSPAARQGRVVQRQRLARRLQRAQRLANARVIERRQPQPLDRPAVAAQLHDLAGDHLAFAVGVGGDHQFARLGEQLLHGLELRSGLGLDLDAPALGKNGKLVDGPALELLAVGFWRRCFDQVSDAPGHDGAGAAVAAIASLAGAQHAGDVLALGRLLAQEHAHEASSGMCGSSNGPSLAGPADAGSKKADWRSPRFVHKSSAAGAAGGSYRESDWNSVDDLGAIPWG
jgi:hypothetical protein